MRVLPQTLCPHCGQTMPPAVDFFGLRLTPMERLMMISVHQSGPNGASRERLDRDIYGVVPDNDTSRRVTKMRLNCKLATVGREIVYSRFDHRYRLVNYREAQNVGKAGNGSDAGPSAGPDQRDRSGDREHVADAEGRGGGLQGGRRRPTNRLRGERTP